MTIHTKSALFALLFFVFLIENSILWNREAVFTLYQFNLPIIPRDSKGFYGLDVNLSEEHSIVFLSLKQKKKKDQDRERRKS